MITNQVGSSDSDPVRAGYAALRRGDLPGLLAVIAEDVAIDRPALHCWGAQQRGRAYFAQVIGRMVACADFAVTQEQVVAMPGGAAGTLAYTLTARRTGETLQVRIVELFAVTAGLITRIDVYDKDPAAVGAFLLRAEAGLAPPA